MRCYRRIRNGNGKTAEQKKMSGMKYIKKKATTYVILKEKEANAVWTYLSHVGPTPNTKRC